MPVVHSMSLYLCPHSIYYPVDGGTGPEEQTQSHVVRCVRQNSERQAVSVKMQVKEEVITSRKGYRERDEAMLAMFPVTLGMNDNKRGYFMLGYIFSSLCTH